MTNDSANPPQLPKEALLKAVLKALGNDGAGSMGEDLGCSSGGPMLLRALLERAQVTPEQVAALEMLLAAHGREDDSEEQVIEVETDGDDFDSGDDAVDERDEIRSMQRELADLREVNDTVAAALGACRICWGGDRDCNVCGGRGRAGSAAPNLALFERLVVPAVQRVRRIKQASRAEAFHQRR